MPEGKQGKGRIGIGNSVDGQNSSKLTKAVKPVCLKDDGRGNDVCVIIGTKFINILTFICQRDALFAN